MRVWHLFDPLQQLKVLFLLALSAELALAVGGIADVKVLTIAVFGPVGGLWSIAYSRLVIGSVGRSLARIYLIMISQRVGLLALGIPWMLRGHGTKLALIYSAGQLGSGIEVAFNNIIVM